MNSSVECAVAGGELRASDIMQRHFIAIRPDAPVRELVALLGYYGVGDVDVVDRRGTAMGTASAGALFQLAAEEARAPRFTIPREPAWYELAMVRRPVHSMEQWQRFVQPVLDGISEHILDDWIVADVLAPVTISVSPTATTSEIAYRLLRAGRERAPVIEDGRMIGVITLTDLLRAIARSGHTRSWEPDEPYKVAVDALP